MRGEAIQVYDGPAYKILRSYLDVQNDVDVYIISAKYGVIRGIDIIEPYDELMSDEKRDMYRTKYADMFKAMIPKYRDVFFLKMGDRYDILPTNISNVKIPDKGPIGVMLSSYRRWLFDSRRIETNIWF